MSQSKVKIFSFGKMVAPAIAAVIVVSITTMNGCTPGGQSTEGRDDEISQNALEAEQAEAKLAAQGPEATKAEAGKAEKAEGTKKAEVKTAKKEAKAPDHAVAKTEEKKSTRSVASAGGVYVVQVGAFKVKENAEKLQAKLKEAGFNAKMESIEHSKNGLLHLIRLPASSRAEAETVVEELHAKQDLQAQVVPAPTAAH